MCRSVVWGLAFLGMCSNRLLFGMAAVPTDVLAKLPNELLLMQVAPRLSHDALSCLARVDKYRYRLLVPELRKRSREEKIVYRLHRQGKLADEEREDLKRLLWPLARPLVLSDEKELRKSGWCCFSQPIECALYAVLDDERAFVVCDSLLAKAKEIAKMDPMKKDDVWQAYLMRFTNEIHKRRAQIAAVHSLEKSISLGAMRSAMQVVAYLGSFFEDEHR